MADSHDPLAPLGRWSSLLFLVSGTVGLGYASLYGMEAFAGTYPAIRDFLGPVSYIIAFVGLLGLHSRLSDRSPLLAHAGAVCAGLAIVGFLISLLTSAGVVASDLPGWIEASQFIFILGGWVLSFLLYSIASLRSDVFPRAVGLVLLGPIAVQALNLGVVIAGLSSPEARLLNSGLWALSYLAIGVALRTYGARTDATGSAVDPAA